MDAKINFAIPSVSTLDRFKVNKLICLRECPHGGDGLEVLNLPDNHLKDFKADLTQLGGFYGVDIEVLR